VGTRVDLAVERHPEHEQGIRLFVERDPAGNLKYLNWQIKVLASGQAPATEIADVVDLFHKFSGRRHTHPHPSHIAQRRATVRSDLYSYRPQDLTALRETLLASERDQNKRRKRRERLYRIVGAVEAEVVYETDDLVVRHIKNKQASVHHGLSTRWCIAMKREGYFEEYETQNATFFFFERKQPRGDEFDKSALMVARTADGGLESATCSTSLDAQVDVLALVKAYGLHAFDALRALYECSERYPGSAVAAVLAGTATVEQLERVITTLASSRDVYEVDQILVAICCNDAAPWTLLDGLSRVAVKLSRAAQKRRSWPRRRARGDPERLLTRQVAAATSIHPNAPPAERERLSRWLRRCHVNTDSIRVDRGRYGVSVSMRMRGERETRTPRHRRWWRIRDLPMGELVRRVGMYERKIKKMKKAIQKKRRDLAKRQRRSTA
jgi:hypothetical protein